jgi:hypothetical protein
MKQDRGSGDRCGSGVLVGATLDWESEGTRQECALCGAELVADAVEWRVSTGGEIVGFACEQCGRRETPQESVGGLLARVPAFLRTGSIACVQWTWQGSAYLLAACPSLHNKRRRGGCPTYADVRIGVVSVNSPSVALEKRALAIRGLVSELRRFLASEVILEGGPWLESPATMFAGGMKGIAPDQAQQLLLSLVASNFEGLLSGGQGR